MNLDAQRAVLSRERIDRRPVGRGRLPGGETHVYPVPQRTQLGVQRFRPDESGGGGACGWDRGRACHHRDEPQR